MNAAPAYMYNGHSSRGQDRHEILNVIRKSKIIFKKLKVITSASNQYVTLYHHSSCIMVPINSR
jgi:hypothetical protein